MADELGPWDPMTPAEVAALLGPLAAPWWVAGGWAIELFLGYTVRPHGDVDVLLLRRDQEWVHKVLKGWDIQAADPPGSLRPWHEGERLPAEVHDIWCREALGGPWRFQFMLDEADGDQWRSRRDVRLRRPVSSLGFRTDDGILVLAPEVQLFYKAFGRRPKDEVDFAAALPVLGSDARQWLDEALGMAAPSHPWRDVLHG
jgi:hypothetical protein